MGDQEQQHHLKQLSELQKPENVRSRWTPKPEQILILETIFNNGMVNPPKEETIRIRKLLEKFGNVGDANVFYWFQNRRSRSRRRQRLIQAATTLNLSEQHAQSRKPGFSTGFMPPQPPPASIQSPSSVIVGSSSTSRINDDENLMYVGNYCPQQNIDEKYDAGGGSGSGGGGDGGGLNFCNLDSRNSHNQYDIITVMINGVPTRVQNGPLDTLAMYGQDVMLFHSTGFPVAVNNYGILLEPLQHGESYFLVPRQT